LLKILKKMKYNSKQKAFAIVGANHTGKREGDVFMRNQTTLERYQGQKKRKLTPDEYSEDRKKAMREIEDARNKRILLK